MTCTGEIGFERNGCGEIADPGGASFLGFGSGFQQLQFGPESVSALTATPETAGRVRVIDLVQGDAGPMPAQILANGQGVDLTNATALLLRLKGRPNGAEVASVPIPLENIYELTAGRFQLEISSAYTSALRQIWAEVEVTFSNSVTLVYGTSKVLLRIRPNLEV